MGRLAKRHYEQIHDYVTRIKGLRYIINHPNENVITQYNEVMLNDLIVELRGYCKALQLTLDLTTEYIRVLIKVKVIDEAKFE